MMLKKGLLAALTLTLAWTAPAAAATIQFDPDGLGAGLTFQNIDTLDWTPGNTMAIGVNVNSPVGTTFQTLYQANLGSALLSGGGTVFVQSSTGIEQPVSGPNPEAAVWYSVVGSFGEKIISKTVPSGGLIDIGFDFDPLQASSFTIYANTIGQADSLTGVCFVCGTAVLSGNVIGTGFVSDFTGVTSVANGNLDQAGLAGSEDNYAGIQTITGSGKFNINVAVTSVNGDYFKSIALGDVISFGNFNGNTNLPFTGVDPSACFHSTAHLGGTGSAALLNPANCVGGTGGVGTVGGINGLGTQQANPGLGNRIMFQSDSSTTFQVAQTAIPEPATLALLGVGLLGAVAMRRRKQNKK